MCVCEGVYVCVCIRVHKKVSLFLLQCMKLIACILSFILSYMLLSYDVPLNPTIPSHQPPCTPTLSTPTSFNLTYITPKSPNLLRHHIHSHTIHPHQSPSVLRHHIHSHTIQPHQSPRLLRHLLKSVMDVFQPAISYSPLLDNASDVARQTEANSLLSHRCVFLCSVMLWLLLSRQQPIESLVCCCVV